MPQKQNPVGPSAIVALSHQIAGLSSSLHISATHQHQRDGAAWFAEWMVLPQIMLSGAAALEHAKTLSVQITPQIVQMETALAGLGLIHAEALSFALAEIMPRPDAQAAAKTLCAEAQKTGTDLASLTLAAYPTIDPSIFQPADQMGHAPDQARAFVAVKAL